MPQRDESHLLLQRAAIGHGYVSIDHYACWLEGAPTTAYTEGGAESAGARRRTARYASRNRIGHRERTRRAVAGEPVVGGTRR